MKPKRVLHVIDSLHLGGAQEVVMNIVNGANRERYVHEVATMHGRGIYWDRLAAQGVPLHSLSPHKLVPLYVPALAALLKKGAFDILHCHLIAANIVAKPIGAACGVPLILNHDHTNDPKRGDVAWLLALDRWANGFAQHHVAVSASCRDFLISREGIPPENISLVLNAIHVARFQPQRTHRSPGAPFIAGVGRLNAQKNFSLFLEIAAQVAIRHPDARFLIAGTGPEEQHLRSEAARLGIADQVTFAGYVADPRTIYEKADLLLMPSNFEGLPMTLLEAMAMEVPVVASRLDGIAEVIDDGVDGALCTPGDASAFVTAINHLLSDPAARTAMGVAAREKVLSRFSARRMVDEIEEIYDRLLP